MDFVKQACTEWDENHLKSKLSCSGRPRRSENHLAQRTDGHKIVKTLLQKAFDKLDDRVINIAEQTVVNALEICDEDYNKEFFKVALKNALIELFVSIKDD